MADKVSNTAQDTVSKEATAEVTNTKAEKPLVPFTQLWRFSTPGEKVLVVVGSILSLAYVCVTGQGCQPVIRGRSPGARGAPGETSTRSPIAPVWMLR